MHRGLLLALQFPRLVRLACCIVHRSATLLASCLEFLPGNYRNAAKLLAY